jgi:hypothetical protein
VQQRQRPDIDGRLTWRQYAVQIEHDEFLHASLTSQPLEYNLILRPSLARAVAAGCAVSMQGLR